MSKNFTQAVKTSLLILGLFSFGYNASMVLHELGHALATWLSGGSVVWIEINPLSWSYMLEGTDSQYPIVSTVAGMVMDCGLSLILATVFWKSRSVISPLIYMTAVISWVSNGLYYIIDVILEEGGDPSSLVELGVHKGLIVSIGFILVILGLFFGKLILSRMMGGFGIVARILILMGGIYPYLLAMYIYQLVNPAATVLLSPHYLAVGAIMVPILAVMTNKGNYVSKMVKNVNNIAPDWRTITASYGGALIIILFSTLILPGWFESRIIMTTESKILYFENKNHYIGTLTTRPDTPTLNDIFKMMLKPWDVLVFWNIDGKEGQWHCPKTDEEELVSSFLPHQAFYSQKLNGLVAQAFNGIYTISLHDSDVNWIWHSKDFIIRQAVLSPNKRYYSMMLIDFTEGNTTIYVSGLDLTTQNLSLYKVPTSPKRISFIKNNQAIASGGINPIYINFGEQEEITFKSAKSIAENKTIEGSIDGQLVTSIDSDQFDFQNGAIQASVDNTMWAKVGSDSFLWVLSWEGEVFRINNEGQKQQMGKVDEEITGLSYGILEDGGIWIATSNNRVHIFGESSEIIEIPIPSVSVEVELE